MRKRKDKSKFFISLILLACAILVSVMSFVKLGKIYMGYYRTENEYDNLRKRVQISIPDTKEILNGEDVYFLVDFELLQRENPDCIGWIYFPNLDISYPVMQGKDNNEYLRKTFSGEFASAGSIFIDSTNAADFSDKNTLVYGHNMKNESMFGLLKKYEEKDFFQDNSGFYICTPDACDYYDIFSCYLSKTDEMEDFLQTEFGDEQTFQEFVNEVKDRSIYDTGVKVDIKQNIVTLVTCSTTGNEYRLFIHAIKKKS